MKIPASVLREFAATHDLEVGKRGRVSHEVVLAYLRANPALTRTLAAEAGIPVGKRGRLSGEVFEAVATSV